eukprot:COSAG02_NODE_1371_length_13018_cov_6.783265_9_plen_95_part_00
MARATGASPHATRTRQPLKKVLVTESAPANCVKCCISVDLVFTVVSLRACYGRTASGIVRRPTMDDAALETSCWAASVSARGVPIKTSDRSGSR